MQSRSPDKRVAIICLTLAAMVWLVFGQTLRFGFVNYDDDTYVYNNPHITAGLSFSALRWAFTHSHSNNWHPLTTLTHLFDCQLYGLHPWGHHLGNVLLHSLAVIFLFLALRELTGALWPSAVAAALFAIHPLRAESVAWISERKDSLSGLFFMLTLLAYARYARAAKSWPSYLALLLSFALALMSKATVVPLPFLLLLLDWWPLARLHASPSPAINRDPSSGKISSRVDRDDPAAGGIRRARPAARVNPTSSLSNPPIQPQIPHSTSFHLLLIEKLPLFILSAASCAVTWWVQVPTLAVTVSLPYRVANAIVSCAIYLLQFFWPAGLAPAYPHPGDALPIWQLDAALLLLLAISVAVFLLAKQMPWLTVGWLWYLGMLVPVIGIIQAGRQAHADRYTYLPEIGIALALTWTGAWLIARFRPPRPAAAILSGALLVPLTIAAHRQAAYWRDSETLWTHAIACTRDNYDAHLGLGDAYEEDRLFAAAIAQFQEALRIRPDSAEPLYNSANTLMDAGYTTGAIPLYQRSIQLDPRNPEPLINLGNALLQSGDFTAAMVQYRRALVLDPRNLQAVNNLGNALAQSGDSAAAMVQYRRAVALDPRNPQAVNNLGNALAQAGRPQEAIAQFQQAIRLNPAFADAHNNLGYACDRQGRYLEAIAEYEKAIAARPDFAQAIGNLAYLLAASPRLSLRDGPRALTLAQRANQLTGASNPFMLRALAAAYAQTGRFPEAIRTVRQAILRADTPQAAGISALLQRQLALYQSNQPLPNNE